MSFLNSIRDVLATYNDRYDFMKGVTHEDCYHYMFACTFIFFDIPKFISKVF